MNTVKPLSFILAAIFFLIVSCQHKAAPAITERKAPLPRINQPVYAPPGTVSPDTLQGKTVYMARCNRCHGLPSTDIYSATQWESILLLMIPRAGIDNINAVHLRAYVMDHAAKR